MVRAGGGGGGGGPDLKALLLACLDPAAGNREEVRLAAAFCLGHVAAGDMAEFLPVILTSLQRAGSGAGAGAYLLLAALRDVISVHSGRRDLDFQPFVPAVLPVLLQQCAEPPETAGAGQADAPSAMSLSADERCVV